MSTLATILLQAQPPGGGGLTSTLVLVGMMFLVFYLLVWRPQAKEQEKHDKFINALKKGDEIVTSSGILGTVSKIEDKTVHIKVANRTTIEVLRSQIQGSQAALLADADAVGAAEGKDSAKDKDSAEDDGGEGEDDKKKGSEW